MCLSMQRTILAPIPPFKAVDGVQQRGHGLVGGPARSIVLVEQRIDVPQDKLRSPISSMVILPLRLDGSESAFAVTSGGSGAVQ